MIRSRNVNEKGLQQTRPLTLSSAFAAFARFLDMLRRIARERVPTIKPRRFARERVPTMLRRFARERVPAIVLFFTLMSWSLCGSAKDWKVIRFGVDPSYPPFESKAADGSLVGFDIDLGNALCAKLNAKCVWVENDFDGMIPALQARKIDAVLSDMSVTEKRLQQIDFTEKISYSPTRMVAKAGSNLLPTAESLRGKNIGVEQGTIQETYAKIYFEPHGVNVVSYQNQDQVYADLKSGRLDASLQDEAQASIGFLRTPEGEGFGFCGPELQDPKILGSAAAIGLRKVDTDLKNALNNALAELLKDGSYQTIAKKYFDFNIYGN